jgi:transposase
MMEQTDESGELAERVAALDIGKASVMACIRVPHEDGRRRSQEVCEYGTTTGALLALAGRLHRQGVTLVVMEATSDYWKPVFYLLEAEGFTCWLLNARHVKNVPGRPKTDKLDAVWLAKVAERGMCRPSLVHPRPIRELRDLTRYRRSLIRERTAEKQRVEKLLEDAQIKLSPVASNIFGVSGRQMLAALLGGQRDPKILARMARGRMRAKIPQLQQALAGNFTGHHAFLLQMMLDRIDGLTARIEEVTVRIEEQVAPYARAVEQLDEIAGVGVTSAQELIAELGIDMTRFPTAGHLVSWPSSPPSTAAPPASRRAAPPARATPGSPPPPARSSPRRPGPTPSPASGTTGSPAAAARGARSSPSATPSSRSSGTCFPIPVPATTTSATATTRHAPTAGTASTTSSASSSA